MASPAPASVPREVPPERALPEPTIGVSGVIGGGLTSVPLGTTTGLIAGVATTRAGLPLIKAGAESVEKILAAMVRFFVLMRSRQERWIVSKGRSAGISAGDVYDLIAEEAGRQAIFQRGVLRRVQRDAMRALQLPEPERLPAVRAILNRERVYARQRSEAVAVRAFAALDRIVLRRDSPSGAFWELDENGKTHTAGCLILAGRVYPWEILDVTHPPFGHAGCRCRLRERRKGERVTSLRVARRLVAEAKAAEEAEHGH